MGHLVFKTNTEDDHDPLLAGSAASAQLEQRVPHFGGLMCAYGGATQAAYNNTYLPTPLTYSSTGLYPLFNFLPLYLLTNAVKSTLTPIFFSKM